MTNRADPRIRRRRSLGQEPAANEITPESMYRDRRTWLRQVGAAGLGLGLTSGLGAGRAAAAADLPPPFPDVKPGPYSTNEKRNTWDEATSYNNFYELGTSKEDPKENAHFLKPRPWALVCEGELGKPQTLDLDTIYAQHPLEERVYRFRCVEAWSMVIPWVGFPLSDLLKGLDPTSRAKYVAFQTLHDPDMLPGQRRGVLDWPYVEGLRMDEAMHPLTMLVVGMYGRVLPNQNGAPLRLIVPWKYGFKSIKSIVKIRLQEKQPRTSWSQSNPSEYGFYANVNPEVDHPRWSQKKERRIGEFLRRDTVKWNGYGAEVASLYTGMDLKKFY